MDINTYKAQRAVYYKVIVGLLVLTTITFVQPHMFLENYNFPAQLSIAAVKTWLIIMYYMHLKGETLIGWTVGFAAALVAFFFIVVMTDVHHFQNTKESHITSQPHIEVDYHHHETSNEE